MGIQNSLQDHSSHVSLSPSLWQSMSPAVEIEYKAWWALKKLNLDMDRAGLNRLLDINELEELGNDAYLNSKIAKYRLKRWHDQLIARKHFKQGDQVLLYDSKIHLFSGKFKSRWTIHHPGGLSQWISGPVQSQRLHGIQG